MRVVLWRCSASYVYMQLHTKPHFSPQEKEPGCQAGLHVPFISVLVPRCRDCCQATTTLVYSWLTWYCSSSTCGHCKWLDKLVLEQDYLHDRMPLLWHLKGMSLDLTAEVCYVYIVCAFAGSVREMLKLHPHEMEEVNTTNYPKYEVNTHSSLPKRYTHIYSLQFLTTTLQNITTSNFFSLGTWTFARRWGRVWACAYFRVVPIRCGWLVISHNTMRTIATDLLVAPFNFCHTPGSNTA